ncbi:MAG: rRNA maturation RNase YbeY [Candidatus Marinimicrobia bacterium]|jgi:rRNA maturation RNase YbeY|nr:rRNA maturation RNase YbeY [Candidatus Neomarinimicrobiota bacterium]MDP6568393.1 rRNA maturation RNase YbeY [Candidatus Neomarinimicrobiota bacterium]MDP7026170.1 rRNA maturation RNase YbeY [Candidatus Neomarinimicrobiota bacterium]|tara:strand:+ start:5744 stop:6181 length:438 start_codon:yes stop_codon:yes gene_type:complete
MITVTITQGDGILDVNSSTVEQLIETVLKDSNISDAEINVVLGTDELLRQLKLKYFDENVFTDVIAFRLNDEGSELEGEIYISPERAEENANTYGVSFPNELGRLMVHGTLHLLGWEDDDIDKKIAMSNEEDRFLTEIDVTTLIK